MIGILRDQDFNRRPEIWTPIHSVGHEKFGENFWENAVHLFARDDAWSDIVDRIAPNYYMNSA